jgi:hypothetical protein
MSEQVTFTPENTEATLRDSNNILLLLSPIAAESWLKDFYGKVFRANELAADGHSFAQKTIYLCGDLGHLSALDLSDLSEAKQIAVISELSHGEMPACDTPAWQYVSLGQVPILIHGVGVYYRRFFDPDCDYFNRISHEHIFQDLTESNKPGKAHRTGIYLTPVRQAGEELHFHLLRCSTNLSGPSENFGINDRQIVSALNEQAANIFENQACLNHVLAQIYHNTPAQAEKKQSKAKISAHADKTKDMPTNGIMAFCTFYDQLDKLRPLSKDPFDCGYKETSGLTKLHFRLKAPVLNDPECTLAPQFTLTLYPNSVFFMPLSTNRLYTHEIQSSILDAERLPIRLGYVVRCSKTEAFHKEGQTYLNLDGQALKLEPPTLEGMEKLRHLYAEENKTPAVIAYGDQFRFSMNKGDYLAPTYAREEPFRVYSLENQANLFDALLASVRFERLGKGRQGTVLIQPSESGGIPIVRTTTVYSAPAQLFSSEHERLAKHIQARASLPVGFNNALIETYTHEYTNMGSHSDQALDLADGSFIALYSCYKYPELTRSQRKLVIESKQAGEFKREIVLDHNSVVLFSVDSNRRYKHKIVLETSSPKSENPWLGITFRCSKTFLHFRDQVAYFADNTRLTLANDEELSAFYPLRRRENQETDFRYPVLTYTVSPSDLMPPES